MTYTWSVPAGDAITGSTRIKDTDNKIGNTIDDLVDFVNGEGGHAGQGLTYDLVTKDTAQTISGDKTFTGAIVGSLTGNATSATNANTVNGLTVETAVPTGAVFTDTTLSNAEVKTAYEANANTNAYTDTEKSKLAGVASGAEVNVNADWNASSGDAQILNKPTIPTVPTMSITIASTSIGNDTTVTLPANAVMLQGYASIYGGSNAGARLSAQIKNSGGSVIDTLDLCGTNYTNGSDGGSGMYDSHSFSILLPNNAHSVRFYRSSGSQGISGTINQYMIYG